MYFSLLAYVFLSKDGIPRTSPSPNRGGHRALLCRDPLSASFLDASVCGAAASPAPLRGLPGAQGLLLAFQQLASERLFRGLRTP